MPGRSSRVEGTPDRDGVRPVEEGGGGGRKGGFRRVVALEALGLGAIARTPLARILMGCGGEGDDALHAVNPRLMAVRLERRHARQKQERQHRLDQKGQEAGGDHGCKSGPV